MAVVVRQRDIDESGYWDAETCMTLMCQGCRTVSFCIDESGAGCPVGEETRTLYPGRIAGRPRLHYSHFLPHGLWRIYHETWKALSNDQPILAGIGIGAIVETVCKERNATGGTLKQRIDDLAQQSVITPAAADVLHTLRDMRNDAAHEVKANTIKELSIAFGVVENLIQNVYIIPMQAAKLRKKRGTAAS